MTTQDKPIDVDSQCQATVTDFLKEKMGLCKMAFGKVAPITTEEANPDLVNLSETKKEKIAGTALAQGSGAGKLNNIRRSRQAQLDSVFKDGPS